MAEFYRYLELSLFNRALQKAAFATFIPIPYGQIDRVFCLRKKCSPSSTIIMSFSLLLMSSTTYGRSNNACIQGGITALTSQLEPGHKVALDRLLVSEREQPSQLAWLFQPPGKINGKNVLQLIDRLYTKVSMALPDGIALSVHQNRLLKLTREGRKMSSRDLAKFSDARRNMPHLLSSKNILPSHPLK